jgi:hypothetical protein
VAFGLVAAVVAPRELRRVAAVALGIAVFSHYLLDLPMHTPDMPIGLGANSPKLGLGLWHYRYLSLLAELVVFVAGAVIYLRTFKPGKGILIYLAVLFLLTLATPFFPDPPSERAFGIQALVGYLVLALVAHFVDRGKIRAAGSAQGT